MKPFTEREIFDEDSIKYGERDGVVVEKGVILNEDFFLKNFKDFGSTLSFWAAYPDYFIDLITPTESNFKLFFYQRITLRALMRFKEVYVTAPRAFSKSFITILGLMLQCIFMPGTKRFICAPKKGQSAQIANFATLHREVY